MKRKMTNRDDEVEILYRALKEQNEIARFSDEDLNQILKIERVLNEKHRIKVDSFTAKNDLKKEVIHSGTEIVKTGIGVGAGFIALKTVLNFEKTGVITTVSGKAILSGIMKVFRFF